MKREMARRTLVICMALCMLTAAGCRSDKDSKEESTTKTQTERRVDDDDNETTEEETFVSTSEAVSDTTSNKTDSSETNTDPSLKDPEAVSEDPLKDPAGDEISVDQVTEGSTEPEQVGEREVQRYIRAALNYYNEQAETPLKLVVFDSQIEETDEGYKFQVRSQDGKDANVLVAEVTVNTATGEMKDEWDHTWNVEDYD